MNELQESTIKYGLALFLFCQAAVLSSRFARAFRTAEYLGKNLQREVENKTFMLTEQTNAALDAKKKVEGMNTELTNLSSELEDTNHKLKETDKQKTLFFQNITHELRTPLTLILGPLESLSAKISGKAGDEIGIAIRNANKLLELVNQLLDISKLDAGKMGLWARKIDIVKFLEITISAFDSKFAEKNLILSFENKLDKLMAYIDPEKLEKVINNLLTNAFKFTEKGEVKVILKEIDGKVIIKVKDTGVGIPEKDLPYIFDRFHQVDGSSTREQEGTGIGLALVKKHVKLHHGEVSVTSTVGETEFTIILLLGREHLSDGEIDQRQYNVQTGLKRRKADLDPTAILSDEIRISDDTTPAKAQHSEILLIVEDNEDMRKYIKGILSLYYKKIIEAVNGAEGLKMAKEKLPDIILSDVMMPKMDGHQMLVELKNDDDTKGIPVILLTAKASENFKIESLESGANDYLSKPFNSRELLARINNILTIKRQAEEIKKNIEKILEKQFKLIMAGEMMGDLFHDIKNIFGRSIYSVSIIREDILDIFKLLELTDNWSDVISAIFIKSTLSRQDKERRKNLILSKMDIDQEIAEGIAGRMFSDDDKMLEFAQGLTQLEEDQRNFFFKFVDIAKLFDMLQKANKEAEKLSYSVLNQVRGESEDNQCCNFDDVIDSCMTMAEKRLKNSEIKTDVNIQTAAVGISYPNLHTIILNLLNNSNDAFKKSAQKEKIVKIYSEEKDGYIHITVEDNGSGIPEDIQSKIFEKNFSTKGDKGNGIGLAVCKSLLNKINGDIILESKQGCTKFKVVLPKVA